MRWQVRGRVWPACAPRLRAPGPACRAGLHAQLQHEPPPPAHASGAAAAAVRASAPHMPDEQRRQNAADAVYKLMAMLGLDDEPSDDPAAGEGQPSAAPATP